MRIQQPANSRGPAAFGLKKGAADLNRNEYTLGILLPLPTHDAAEVLQ